MVYMPAQLANQAGDAAYIFSNGFFEAGLMHIMGLLIAIFLFSKRDSWRAVAKLGFPAMLFNIQEPIAFGACPLCSIPSFWCLIYWLPWPILW